MRTLRSAASVAASLALLIGVPWLLSATIGNPLDRVPDLLAGDVGGGQHRRGGFAGGGRVRGESGRGARAE